MPPQTRSQTSHTSAISERSKDHPRHRIARLTPKRPILNDPDSPPRYIIDLSLSPFERYLQLAIDFKPLLVSVPSLFDDVVCNFAPSISISAVRFLARRLLRKVHSKEETEELKGISKASGVEMYLLVAFNTFLDVMMGCTSGGVRTKNTEKSQPRMLHFRTLDWGMDILRGLVVQLDFVRHAGGVVIATSITYAGFVGALTGVRLVSFSNIIKWSTCLSDSLNLREGLSISLNFRPNHNLISWCDQFKYYSSHLGVLLGYRPSISALLRRQLFAPIVPRIDDIASNLPSVPSTAAYLIISDGNQTMVIEKDHRTASLRRRKDFIVATNHDQENENQQAIIQNAQDASIVFETEILMESMTRKMCVREKWRNAVIKAVDKDPGESDALDGGDADLGVSVKRHEVIKWLGAWPVTNECTHFAVVMDPKEGKVVWLKRFLGPIENDQ